MGLYKEDYSPALVKIAKGRVFDHIHLLRLVDFNLEQMAVNIYLQGVHDTATALTNSRLDTVPEMIPNQIPQMTTEINSCP
jgi:hypothetical protein